MVEIFIDTNDNYVDAHDNIRILLLLYFRLISVDGMMYKDITKKNELCFVEGILHVTTISSEEPLGKKLKDRMNNNLYFILKIMATCCDSREVLKV